MSEFLMFIGEYVVGWACIAVGVGLLFGLGVFIERMQNHGDH